jgi:hypothetical protein
MHERKRVFTHYAARARTHIHRVTLVSLRSLTLTRGHRYDTHLADMTPILPLFRMNPRREPHC